MRRRLRRPRAPAGPRHPIGRRSSPALSILVNARLRRRRYTGGGGHLRCAAWTSPETPSPSCRRLRSPRRRSAAVPHKFVSGADTRLPEVLPAAAVRPGVPTLTATPGDEYHVHRIHAGANGSSGAEGHPVFGRGHRHCFDDQAASTATVEASIDRHGLEPAPRRRPDDDGQVEPQPARRARCATDHRLGSGGSSSGQRLRPQERDGRIQAVAAA